MRKLFLFAVAVCLLSAGSVLAGESLWDSLSHHSNQEALDWLKNQGDRRQAEEWLHRAAGSPSDQGEMLNWLHQHQNSGSNVDVMQWLKDNGVDSHDTVNWLHRQHREGNHEVMDWLKKQGADLQQADWLRRQHETAIEQWLRTHR